MTRTRIVIAALVALAAGAGLYWLGLQSGKEHAVASASPGPAASAALPQGIAEGEEATRRHIASGLKAGDLDPATGRKILYYHDPMVPANRFDKPGKSPFMDMMLVPVYAGAESDSGNVTISPRIQQNLGLRTATATEGVLSREVSAVGNIAFNERDQVVLQARAGGFVQRLHVRATLDRVARGQALAELYVPDWVAVQEEFLAVRRMQGADLGPLVEGARARMRQAGMSDDQIRRLEASGRVDARTSIVAPIGGLVTEIGAREGMSVVPGATLFRINGFSSVWAHAEVPETQAAPLRRGTMVTARSPAVPGATFEGRVQALLPGVDAATRTVKARIELPNPRGELVPGMFVEMTLRDPRQQKAVLVPTEAVIHTGRRAVVMLAGDNGRFRPVEVEVGIESGGQTEIRKGLKPGQRVVVSSQFLIDSEASLRGLEARLNAEPPAAAAAAARTYQAEGRIEGVVGDAVTLWHGPIPALKWGAMTMEFRAPPPEQMPRNLQPGDAVSFEFTMGPDGPQLTRISPMPPGARR